MKATSIFCIFSTTFIFAFSGVQKVGTTTSFCSGKKQGNYADPERCDGFITCVGMNPVKMDCPAGLHYNAQAKFCDWPQNVNCQIKKVVVKNGNWGRWTSWTSCSVTCGGGKQSRIRICDNPSPAGTGLHCLSSLNTRVVYERTTQVCKKQSCPVISVVINGNWGRWTSWTTCGVTCGGGKQSRVRICDNPSPAGTGLHCLSSLNRRVVYERTTQVCKKQSCPVISETVNSGKCGTRRKGLIIPVEGRIVGGRNAVEGEWPWQVGIIKKSNEFNVFCGGTLINSHTVLTAAHCIKSPGKPEWYAVRVGDMDQGTAEDDEEVVNVKQLIVHNDFNKVTYQNDVAVIILAKNVNLTEACLPEKNIILAENKCFVTGWGNTKQILNLAQVPIIPKPRCKIVMKTRYKDGMLCAGYFKGGIDACQGDSGGPLVCSSRGRPKRFYLKGIVSWGEGCAQNGTYGMYTNVQYYSKWINEALKKGKLPEKL